VLCLGHVHMAPSVFLFHFRRSFNHRAGLVGGRALRSLRSLRHTRMLQQSANLTHHGHTGIRTAPGGGRSYVHSPSYVGFYPYSLPWCRWLQSLRLLFTLTFI
jgi:hypothetical protein